MKHGKLVISLDFELLWGIFDKVDHKEKIRYFENTRKVIPNILDLFLENEISCTWAIVGMLFHKDWKAWDNNKPVSIPVYKNHKLSPYEFGNMISRKGTEVLCFSPELIKRIKDTPGQEVGTHTYSHYYTLEEGQTGEDFEADLKKAIEIADSFDIKLKSLIFPRNQFNEKYLKICYELGIENVRSNPSSWYWKDTQDSSFLNKLFRTGDAYIGLNNKSYDLSELRKKEGHPLEQKASRLLRPVSSNSLMNQLRLKRIKSEMTAAAKRNQIYHLWWHPHNFGDHPEQSMADLGEIIKHFNWCKKEFNFDSFNMQNLRESIKEGT